MQELSITVEICTIEVNLFSEEEGVLGKGGCELHLICKSQVGLGFDDYQRK